MRKYWKTILYTALGVLVVVSAVFSLLHETGDRVAVNIRIEGIKTSFFDKRESIPSKKNELTVKTVLEYVQRKYDDMTIEDLNSNTITNINGDKTGTFGRTDGWYIRVNGKNVSKPIDQLILKSEDSLIVYYGDPENTDMQYPTLDTSKIKDGVIRVIQKDVMTDADGKETVTETPIYGADFTWSYGKGETARLVTDKDGLVTLTGEQLIKGKHEVTISRTDEQGLPLLLRLEPDTVIKTSDTLEIEEGTFIEEYSDQLLIIIGIATLAVIIVAILYSGAKKKQLTRKDETDR